jgi:hypothetical protein
MIKQFPFALLGIAQDERSNELPTGQFATITKEAANTPATVLELFLRADQHQFVAGAERAMTMLQVHAGDVVDRIRAPLLERLAMTRMIRGLGLRRLDRAAGFRGSLRGSLGVGPGVLERPFGTHMRRVYSLSLRTHARGRGCVSPR